MKTPLFYHKQPMFGLDIGSQSIKVMQLEQKQDRSMVRAYGTLRSDVNFMKDGVITNIPEAAKAIDQLLAEKIKGALTTNRVVMGVPVSHVYTRVLTIPNMSRRELDSAVQLEVEQSVPIPSKSLYFDYETTDIGDPENMLVRMVAVPKGIVDSYVSVCDLLKLDLALVQTNIRADAQLCLTYEDVTRDKPYFIVDVGGKSIDIGILDATLRLTGTVDAGGNDFTAAIAKELKVSSAEAHDVKTSQGLGAGKDQRRVLKAVEPILQKVITEIKRMSRFYKERINDKTEISQIIIVGGGANVPGFGDYLTDSTRIPTKVSSPWGKRISFAKLQVPEASDLPLFLTSAGLALAQEDEALGL